MFWTMDTVSPVGAAGAAAHPPPPPTMAVDSVDAGPTPALVPPRTRRKYVPGGTPLAVKLVAVLPVEDCARFARPLAVPASTTCVVGAHVPGGVSQVKTTVEPVTAAPKLAGAAGMQAPPTLIITSFEGTLVPLALRASART
jgi:hypothetical protein